MGQMFKLVDKCLNKPEKGVVIESAAVRLFMRSSALHDSRNWDVK